MNQNPIISIITPVYNLEAYLAETLDSIKNQTYSSWECIIINDGSTDNTEKVALNYCKEDARFHYFYQENKGVSAARNYGIAQSKGEYIMPLDGDDLIMPPYCEEAIRVFKTYPDVKMVTCEGEYFGNAEGKIKVEAYSFSHLLYHNLFFCTSFFKRLDYDKTGGFDASFSLGEDWDFWLSLLHEEDKVICLPYNYFRYRVRKTSKMRTYDEEDKKKLFTHIVDKHKEIYDKMINPIEVLQQLHEFKEKASYWEGRYNRLTQSFLFKIFLIPLQMIYRKLKA
jgi:glycosyltransferase involved in cell wall biosynthesis